MTTPQKESTKDFILFTLIIVLIFGYFYAASFTRLGKVNEPLVNSIVTVLVATLTGLIGWKWGSSQSSKQKDAVISGMISDKATDTVTKAVEAEEVNIQGKEVNVTSNE